MVHMASGVDHGHGRSTNEKNRTLHNMAALLQLHVYVSHAALVYNVHLWYWTYMLWSIDTCQNKVSLLTTITWPYRGLKIRVHRGHAFFRSWPLTYYWFSIRSRTHVRSTCCYQGRVVRKPFNANPGLKVNQSITFSCIQMFFTAYVLCILKTLSLHVFRLKTEGQTT